MSACRRSRCGGRPRRQPPTRRSPRLPPRPRRQAPRLTRPGAALLTVRTGLAQRRAAAAASWTRAMTTRSWRACCASTAWWRRWAGVAVGVQRGCGHWGVGTGVWVGGCGVPRGCAGCRGVGARCRGAGTGLRVVGCAGAGCATSRLELLSYAGCRGHGMLQPRTLVRVRGGANLLVWDTRSGARAGARPSLPLTPCPFTLVPTP